MSSRDIHSVSNSSLQTGVKRWFGWIVVMGEFKGNQDIDEQTVKIFYKKKIQWLISISLNILEKTLLAVSQCTSSN